MTKERLEEIRKRKYAEDRIVYTVFDNDEEATALHIVYDNELFIAYMMLKRVFETKEQAEWYAKTYAERTERFEPPMWEEIEDHYGFNFISNGVHYYLAVYKHKDCNEIDVVEVCGNTLFVRLATKENYEKACEIVKNLFKGESNGKEEVE